MHSEICISANGNYDWGLSLSARYFLLIVVHPIFWLLHRLGSFKENSKSYPGATGTQLVCQGVDLGAHPPVFSTTTPLSESAPSFPYYVAQTQHPALQGPKPRPAFLQDPSQVTLPLYSAVTL